MEQYFISDGNLKEFLSTLSQKYNVYSPYIKGDKQLTGILSEDTLYFFNSYRISAPIIKSLLFGSIEKLVPLPGTPEKKNVIFGVKACDLASLPVMDYVFQEGDFQDPLYVQNRENTIIISSDCTDCLDTCFCTLVENNPYPEKYFDINISPVKDGYILTVATEKGKSLLNMEYLQKPADNQLKMIEVNRDKIHQKIKSQVAEKNYNIIGSSTQKAVMDNFESDVWKEVTENCVECGGCNFVCPTCHCFILSDHDNNRYRQWDACQYKGFAVVAGGANPRKKLNERLRNRYVKKFDFFQKNINLNGCTGCGRCIHACIGKIDIREVLNKLVAK